MTTLLHLTGDDGRHVGHAVRSTALLAGHDELAPSRSFCWLIATRQGWCC
jgi:hypothetical protein